MWTSGAGVVAGSARLHVLKRAKHRRAVVRIREEPRLDDDQARTPPPQCRQSRPGACRRARGRSRPAPPPARRAAARSAVSPSRETSGETRDRARTRARWRRGSVRPLPTSRTVPTTASRQHDVGQRRGLPRSDERPRERRAQQPPRRIRREHLDRREILRCPATSSDSRYLDSPPVTTTSGTAQSSAPAAAAPASTSASWTRRRSNSSPTTQRSSGPVSHIVWDAHADDETRGGRRDQPRPRQAARPGVQAAQAPQEARLRPRATTTSAGVSDSGRAAVNQKSGDITAISRRQKRQGGARPTAIQNSVKTNSAQRAGDDAPEREAAGGAAIAIPPGRDPRRSACVDAFASADEHRIARRVRAMRARRRTCSTPSAKLIESMSSSVRGRARRCATQEHQAGKRDEQAKSRCHEMARHARPPRSTAKRDAGARLR